MFACSTFSVRALSAAVLAAALIAFGGVQAVAKSPVSSGAEKASLMEKQVTDKGKVSAQIPQRGMLVLVTRGQRYTVTKATVTPNVVVDYRPLGINMVHMGDDPGRVQMTLRLADGRTVTVTATTNQGTIQRSYAVLE